MDKALLTFSDGSTLTIKEGQYLVPIISYKSNKEDEKKEVSLDKSFEVWLHVHDGLVPALCEFLANCDFFFLQGNDSVIYRSTSVIKIKHI